MIIKAKYQVPFVQIANRIVQSPLMSAKEKGVLVYLLSLPQDWIVRKETLHNSFADDRDSIKKAFNGLVKLGFIIEVKKVNKKGQFSGVDYVIYLESQTIAELSWETNSGKPVIGKPNIGKATTTKKENTNKEYLNKESNISLLKFLNSTLDRKYRTITDKTKSHIKLRLKEGFTLNDIETAIYNCSQDDYHKETNFKYLTLEFITRPDQLDKWLNATPKKVKHIRVTAEEAMMMALKSL